MITIIVGVACLVAGHLWGGQIWPAIKAKIWPGSVPVTPEQVAATKPPPTP